MTSLKRHFLKNLPTKFDKIFKKGVKLMSDKVLKVWWRYLTYFLSYREYSRGGAESAPPPSGARVKPQTTMLSYQILSSLTPCGIKHSAHHVVVSNIQLTMWSYQHSALHVVVSNTQLTMWSYQTLSSPGGRSKHSVQTAGSDMDCM